MFGLSGNFPVNGELLPNGILDWMLDDWQQGTFLNGDPKLEIIILAQFIKNCFLAMWSNMSNEREENMSGPCQEWLSSWLAGFPEKTDHPSGHRDWLYRLRTQPEREEI